MWHLHLVTALVGTGIQAQPTVTSGVVMKEAVAVGAAFEVQTTVSLSGTRIGSTADAKNSEETTIRALWSSRYRERIVELSDDHKEAVCARRYLTASLERGRGDPVRRTTLRPAIQRIILRRERQDSTIYSPDGPLTTQELDLLRAESFTLALRGLLPSKAVSIGDRWQASAESAAELTGVDPIQSGAVNCNVRDVKSTGDGALIRVGLTGTVTGPSEHGPSRQTVDGHFLYDLDHQLISHIVLSGQSEIFDERGKVVQRLDGRFEMTRKPSIEDPRLSNAALAGVSTKPTAESTMLLFEESGVPVRFTFPRNWELTSVHKNVVQLDEPTGGRLLLTVDPTPPPNADKLRTDLMAWLNSQKARVTESGSVEPAMKTDDQRMDRFTVRAVVNGKEKEWRYLVIRAGDRSSTVAANLFAERSAALAKDVEAISRSLEFAAKSK
jgi:hypothetical protein